MRSTWRGGESARGEGGGGPGHVGDLRLVLRHGMPPPLLNCVLPATFVLPHPWPAVSRLHTLSRPQEAQMERALAHQAVLKLMRGPTCQVEARGEWVGWGGARRHVLRARQRVLAGSWCTQAVGVSGSEAVCVSGSVCRGRRWLSEIPTRVVFRGSQNLLSTEGVQSSPLLAGLRRHAQHAWQGTAIPCRHAQRPQHQQTPTLNLPLPPTNAPLATTVKYHCLWPRTSTTASLAAGEGNSVPPVSSSGSKVSRSSHASVSDSSAVSGAVVEML